MSGSTNSKISSQNDQVRRQYKYDKEYWRYQNNENSQRYEDKKEATRLSQQFLDDQRVYADVRNFQDYRLAKQVQDQQYDVATEAYNIRSNTRDQQLGINERSAALATENETRKFDEGILDIFYAAGDEQRRFDTSLAASNFQGSEATRGLSSALNVFGTNSKQNLLDLQQKTANTDLQGAEATRRADTAKGLAGFDIETANIRGAQEEAGFNNKLGQLDVADNQSALNLGNIQNEGKANIANFQERQKQSGLNQQSFGVDINQARSDANFQIGNADDQIGKLNNQQDIEAINRQQYTADAALTIGSASDTINKLQNQLTGQGLDRSQYGSDAEFTVGEALDTIRFAKRQQQNRDIISRIEDNAVISDTALKKAGLDINAFQLEKDKAFTSEDALYKQQSNYLDYAKVRAENINERLTQLVQKNRALGQRRAAGQQGKSAQRGNTSILAEYGRSQAQLINNLVFAAGARDIKSQEIQLTAANAIDKINAQIANNRNDVQLLISGRDTALNRSIMERQANENAYLEVQSKGLRTIGKAGTDLAYRVNKSNLESSSTELDITSTNRSITKARKDLGFKTSQSNLRTDSLGKDVSVQNRSKGKALSDSVNKVAKAKLGQQSEQANIRQLQNDIERTNKSMSYQSQSEDLKVLANSIERNTTKNLLSLNGQQTVNAVSRLGLIIADSQIELSNRRTQLAAQVGIDQGVYTNRELLNSNTLLDASSKYSNDMTRINESKRINQSEFDSAQSKFADSEKSLANERDAQLEQIGIDKDFADIKAEAAVGVKPRAPIPLPLPLRIPRQVLPMPTKPTRPPEPIKGAIGKTSVWNDVGDALNVGLSIASIF
jgi:hypothetical protein